MIVVFVAVVFVTMRGEERERELFYLFIEMYEFFK